MNAARCLTLVAGWFAICPTIYAAAPEAKHLLPAGAAKGTAVEVTVAGKLGTRPVHVWCSQSGVAVEIPEKDGPVKITVAEDAQPGLCWLRFFNSEGASELRPFIIGTLPEAVEKEPNNDVAKAHHLEHSSVVNGVLGNSGDVDVYALELKKGQTLVASMEANRRLGSPMDGVLQILSPRGFVLEQNDDHPDLDPQLVFTAEADGVYYTRAFAFPATPNSSIRLAGGADYIYRLTLTTGAFLDHVQPLSVTRGATTEVRLRGWNLPDDLQLLPITADVEGDTVRVHHQQLANTVDLRITAHPTAVEAEGDPNTVTNTIPLPGSVTGVIAQPGEVDEYRFPGTKGQKVVFECRSRTLGFPLDPVLRLLDAKGKVLREVDDPRRNVFDAELAFTLPADGEYRLQVTDLHRRGTFRYAYCVFAAIQEPDYTLSLSEDVFTLKSDKPLEIAVSVSRNNGFNKEIEITAAGLPEGVTVEAAKSEPKGDSSKSVKLVLKFDGAAAFSGPIRVVGKSAGDAPVERVADAPISGVSDRTRNVWLTVIAPKPQEKPAEKNDDEKESGKSDQGESKP